LRMGGLESVLEIASLDETAARDSPRP
jgi:hypothetical protein